MFFYLGLAAILLADAVAIYSASPLMIVVLSGVVLRERVRLQRWIAAAVGFDRRRADSAANLQLVRLSLAFAANRHCVLCARQHFGPQSGPQAAADGNSISPRHMLSGCCWNRFSDFWLVKFFSNVHPSLAFLARGWVLPSTHDAIVSCAVGLMTVSGFFAYAEAYPIAPPSCVAPFEYSAMIWAVGLGFLFFLATC